MLSKEQIEEHLNVLRIACHPESPFRGMINLESDGGLLSLPIPEQQQVRDAMDPELVEMVFDPEGV
jgi:hypothetical protein